MRTERAAEADWRRDRFQRALFAYEHRLFLREPDPSQWTPEEIRHLARLERYVASAARDVDQMRKAINNQLQSRYRLLCTEYRARLVIGELRKAWARDAQPPAEVGGDYEDEDLENE